MSAPIPLWRAALSGQPESRDHLTPAWLLSLASGSAGPLDATDAKCRQSAARTRGGLRIKAIAQNATAGPPRSAAGREAAIPAELFSVAWKAAEVPVPAWSVFPAWSARASGASVSCCGSTILAHTVTGRGVRRSATSG